MVYFNDAGAPEWQDDASVVGVSSGVSSAIITLNPKPYHIHKDIDVLNTKTEPY